MHYFSKFSFYVFIQFFVSVIVVVVAITTTDVLVVVIISLRCQTADVVAAATVTAAVVVVGVVMHSCMHLQYRGRHHCLGLLDWGIESVCSFVWMWLYGRGFNIISYDYHCIVVLLLTGIRSNAIIRFLLLWQCFC